MTERPRLSVVIPTLDEVARLPVLLDDLERLKESGPIEVIVADGGSGDGTREVAARRGALVVRTTPGRGVQLARGAEEATGRWLFFVHADCRLPDAAALALVEHIERAPEDHFAHFAFAMRRTDPLDRFIEWGQAVRERLLGLVYGDQGLVVSRPLYDRAGGYPTWALFEDVEVVDRLGAVGRRVRLAAPLPTSGRRYRSEGRVRALARNVRLMASFRLGANPESLARAYAPRRDDPTRSVVVFAKEPTPGRVKTRLAADIGDVEATRVYRALAEATVDRLREAGWHLSVYVDPGSDDVCRGVAEWLDVPVEHVRPQRGTDLGARMLGAFEERLEEADRVCIVGTDLPDIDVETVDAAFAALDDHDVVFGPATDGGYYLVGMSAPHPELFHDIPWSSETVLATSLERATAAGLSTAQLAPKTDVDTVQDLPETLRAG
ncbi:MAG: TIGR04283 family arsenosugar biosynthesis glycosyltransferase [Gemmatimonadota bacterium]